MATAKKAPCKTFKPGGGVKSEICQICSFRRDVHVVIPGLDYEEPVKPEGKTTVREWTELVVKKVPKQTPAPAADPAPPAPKPKPAAEPPAPKPPPRAKAVEPEPEPAPKEEEPEDEGPFCPECKKQVEGKIVKFEGQMWHKPCWVCHKCKGQLPDLFKFEGTMPVCDTCHGKAADPLAQSTKVNPESPQK